MGAALNDGLPQGLKPRFFGGAGLPRLKPGPISGTRAKAKYGDSGCARMTNENRQRRVICGRKGRAVVVLRAASGSFDCVTHDETVSHSAQDDSPNIVPSQRGGGYLVSILRVMLNWVRESKELMFLTELFLPASVAQSW